jgi:hypothetical protein
VTIHILSDELVDVSGHFFRFVNILFLQTAGVRCVCLEIRSVMKDTKGSWLPHRAVAAAFVIVVLAATSLAQSSDRGVPQENQPGQVKSSSPSLPSAPSPDSPRPGSESQGAQSTRILGIIPNYRAVSANTKVPPLSIKGKFKLATEDSFDYSSLLVAGFTAGISQAKNQTPEFHQGGAGYARYFWHSFADQAVGNYFTEFIVPSVMREDPRYYTRYHGGFIKRTGYSVSRLFVTRTDSGGETFNFSEIIGNGAGAGISDLYYPRQERTWTKTGQKWATQVGLDGVFNVLKEFWPDVRHGVFRQ